MKTVLQFLRELSVESLKNYKNEISSNVSLLDLPADVEEFRAALAKAVEPYKTSDNNYNINKLAEGFLSLLSGQITDADISLPEKVELINDIYGELRARNPEKITGFDELFLQELKLAVDTKLADLFYAKDGMLSGLVHILTMAKAENEHAHDDVVKKLDELIAKIKYWRDTADFELITTDSLHDVCDVLADLSQKTQSSAYIKLARDLLSGEKNKMLSDIITDIAIHSDDIIATSLKILLQAKKDNLERPTVLVELDAIARNISSLLSSEMPESHLKKIVMQIESLVKSGNAFNRNILVVKNIFKNEAERIIQQKQVIQQKEEKKPVKRVAYVDIDRTLIQKGKLNKKLIERLKSNYDEVILFTQRSKYIQDLNVRRQLASLEINPKVPLFITTEQAVVGLAAHGIHNVKVSSSLDHLISKPMEYAPSSLFDYEKMSYEVGLNLRKDEQYKKTGRIEGNNLYRTLELEMTDEINKVREALKTDKKRAEDFYPVSKVDQYRHLTQYVKTRYGEGVEISIFDDNRDNLKEIIEAKEIAEKDKPIAFLVDNEDITVMSTDLLMEILLKKHKLSELMLDPELMQGSFNHQFYTYQIKHAYQIHRWQIDLAVPKIHEDESKILESITAAKKDFDPQDPENGDYIKYRTAVIEYAKLLDKSSGLKLEKAAPTTNRATDIVFNFKLTDIEHRYDEAVKQGLLPAMARETAVKRNRKEVGNASKECAHQFILSVKQLIESINWDGRVSTFMGFGGITIGDKTYPTNVGRIYQLCLDAECDGKYQSHFNEIASIGLKASQSKSFSFFGIIKRDDVTQKFYDNFKNAFEEKENNSKKSKL